MRYILNPNAALRSWRLVPCAYYIRGERNAQGLKKEEFEFLSQCDGRTELPEGKDSMLVASLLRRGLILEMPAGDSVSAWSRLRVCDNRYFPAMNWMITGKCNYNCLHCFNAADNAPLMQEWSLPEAERFLDEAEKCGINAFTITGGEPMCHKDFFPIMEGIYRRGMYVEELNTNGFYLTPEMLGQMREIGCTPLIKISFDGLGYHDWMRNRGMVAVAANGNVFPCMQMSGYYEANHDILGNAKTDGLQKLLQDSRYLSEVCTTLGELAAVNSKCSRCVWFKHCAGGCRAIALALTGNKLGIDPAKCLFFEKGYHERAEKLLSGWTNLSPMEKDIRWR